MEQRLKKRIWGFLLGLMALGIVVGMAQAGNLEPTAPPGPTMKTLDQIPPTWDQVLPATERFQLVMGGAAVLDKETGLVWEKSPSMTIIPWVDAHIACNTKTVGSRKGWRLPTIQELTSLVDPFARIPGPILPYGHPFIDIQSQAYWSATGSVTDANFAWAVHFSGYSFSGLGSNIGAVYKIANADVWCVRGGQSVDLQ